MHKYHTVTTMYATVFLRAKSGVTDKGVTMKSRAARYVPEPTLQLFFISTAMESGCENLESLLCICARLGKPAWAVRPVSCLSVLQSCPWWCWAKLNLILM